MENNKVVQTTSSAPSSSASSRAISASLVDSERGEVDDGYSKVDKSGSSRNKSLGRMTSFQKSNFSIVSCCWKFVDCESSVTMRLRCRRALLLAVVFCALGLNFSLLHKYHQVTAYLAEDDGSDIHDFLEEEFLEEEGTPDGGAGGGGGSLGLGAPVWTNYVGGSSNTSNKITIVTRSDKLKARALRREQSHQLAALNNQAAVAAAAAAADPENAKAAQAALESANRAVASAKAALQAVQFGSNLGGGGGLGSSGGRRRKEAPKLDPLPSSLSADATFSACLLVKDDNDILNEWIAYHYFTLNMRTLIVGIDPNSHQSPTALFDKWRNLTGDLTIVEWRDKHYMPSDFMESGRPPEQFMLHKHNFSFPVNITFPLTDEAILDISNHRYRQRVFLAQCMKQIRAKGLSWMIHVDTDEYITSSKLLRQMNPDYLDIPPMDQPGSVLSLIQQVVKKTPTLVNYPCLSLLRVLFGSVESSHADLYQSVPTGFNPKKFESLRWRYHAKPHNMASHGNPKVLLDVAVIPEEYIPDVVFSIHRPVMAYCRRNTDTSFTSFRKQPIAANHYVGSWERYSARSDSRRSRAVYEKKANHKCCKDDGVRTWLQGFVNMMGQSKAAKLLGEEYVWKIYWNDMIKPE